MYVITDAETAFVLKVIVYTGASTYNFNPDKDVKKTVKIVKELVSQFEGTHRSIYVDRFYTSIELIKELTIMNQYVTGPVMANRLPKEVQISPTSRLLEHGQYIHHKDSKLVFFLTNNHRSFGVGHCYRKTVNGNICLERPKVIEKYNTNMGGVDLADIHFHLCNHINDERIVHVPIVYLLVGFALPWVVCLPLLSLLHIGSLLLVLILVQLRCKIGHYRLTDAFLQTEIQVL